MGHVACFGHSYNYTRERAAPPGRRNVEEVVRPAETEDGPPAPLVVTTSRGGGERHPSARRIAVRGY
jgi:hypothetical protein